MEKRKKTNLEKYGVEHIFQSEDFLELKRKTFFDSLFKSDRLKNIIYQILIKLIIVVLTNITNGNV